jgi:hypothetical protein
MNSRLVKYASLVASLGVTALLAVVGQVGAETPVSVPISPSFTFSGGFVPVALSRSAPTPIALRLSTEVSEPDDTRPPALSELDLELDRRLESNFGKVPACRYIPLSDAPSVSEACRGSVVAIGRVQVEIQFPEEEPVYTAGDLTAYNRIEHGRHSFLVAASLTVPTPETLLIDFPIAPDNDDHYGMRAKGSIPKIAGGSGSITRFVLRFKRGIFSATCPRDDLIRMRQRAVFADGTSLQGELVRTCKPFSR